MVLNDPVHRPWNGPFAPSSQVRRRRRVPLVTMACALAAWLAILAPHVTGQTAFPFTIQDRQFHLSGAPVFLNIIGYQPLEPGQNVGDAIKAERIQDDLRRLRAYRGGTDPILLRVYAQPTLQIPQRMPKAFYDGIRDLDFWIIRDVVFHPDFGASDAVAKGKSAIDAVIDEVAAADAFDRIFAWEIGNEFQASGNDISILEGFLAEMRDHIKARMAEPGRSTFSNWVTWAAWPPADPLRTDGNPISVPSLDYVSFNAYSYDPERMRDHQAGPVTGTPYAGYLAALTARVPDKPVVISESGLPDSSAAVGLDQARLPPLYPSYRRGDLTPEQAAEGIADRYWDARLSGTVAGFGVFEWVDEWWKTGDPSNQATHPEEHFGLGRFVTAPTAHLYKLQQQVIQDLYTMRLPATVPVLTGVMADDTTLLSTGTTALHANLAPGAVAPVRFRWETSAGRIVGDSGTVQFHAGGRALGPATVTVVATDAFGNASQASVTLAVQPGTASLDILTFGTERSSGRVANVDMTQNKVVLYVFTDQFYVQPFIDMKSVWVRNDGYWWSTNTVADPSAQLFAWVVPNGFDPPTPTTMPPPTEIVVASAAMSTRNDSDNDLLPDTFEPSPAQDRYDDPDGDGASHLEEFLNGTDPSSADNDSDNDSLPDTWEQRYFGVLVYGPNDDPDGDGLTNATERTQGTHPGRTNVDRDDDGLPDTWELRRFGNLAHGASDTSNYGLTNLALYEQGVLLFTEDVLAAGMPVRAVHVTELRDRIDALRANYGVGTFSWTDDPLLSGTTIRAAHVTDLRTALNEAYMAAPPPAPTYTDPGLGIGTTVRAVHINELRRFVVALE